MMDGWTVHHGEWWYVAFYGGIEHWFAKESEDTVSLAFGRDVEDAPDELIPASEIGELPEPVRDALDEDGITLRRRAESLQEAMA